MNKMVPVTNSLVIVTNRELFIMIEVETENSIL